MNIHARDAELMLERDGFVQLADAKGVRILCVSGALWITQDSDPRDVSLVGGGEFIIDRPGAVIVHAVDASTVRLKQARVARDCGAPAGRAPLFRAPSSFGALNASLV